MNILFLETASPAKAIQHAQQTGGRLRAPHCSASPHAMAEEIALAAGGTLVLTEVAALKRTTINAIGRVVSAMSPECAPALVIQVNGSWEHARAWDVLKQWSDDPVVHINLGE